MTSSEFCACHAYTCINQTAFLHFLAPAANLGGHLATISSILSYILRSRFISEAIPIIIHCIHINFQKLMLTPSQVTMDTRVVITAATFSASSDPKVLGTVN